MHPTMHPTPRPTTPAPPPPRPAAPDAVHLLVLLLLLLAGAPLAAPLGAQRASSGEGIVRGTVLAERSSEPVARANLVVVGRRISARTDDSGRFALVVPAGSGTLRIAALGYETTTRPFTVAAGDSARLTVVLAPVPQQLGAVTTTARPAERESFEQVPQVGAFTVKASTLRAAPTLAEPDVLRAVTLMPGMVVRSDYTAGYNVRGGESDQNLVLLDGIPVYNPFHLGGLFGTFLDESIQEVNLQTGGFAAPYGGRLSSVLDVTTNSEARRGIHGAATVSLLSTSTVLGGLLPDDRTSWSIGARRTYADRIAGLVTDDGLPYHFWDAQLKLRHLFDDGGYVAITAYGGRDVVDGNIGQFEDDDEPTSDTPGNIGFDWGNQLAGLTWIKPFGPGTIVPLGSGKGMPLGDSARLETRLSVTGFSTGLDLGDGGFVLDNDIRDYRALMALTWWTERHERRFGVEGSQIAVNYDGRYADVGTQAIDLDQSARVGAAHWDDIWRVSPKWQLRWGGRVEHVTGQRWTGVSPRVAAKYFATPDLALTLGGGRYAQWTHAVRNEDVPVRLFDSWITSDEFVPVSTADHAVLGAERWFGGARFVRVEAWGKQYSRVPEQNPADDSLARGDEFLYADGTSYGVDVLLRRLEGGALSGWISYGYAVSARERDGVRYAPAQDRRHTMNALVAWKLRNRWQLASRVAFGSGVPFTDIEGQIVRRVYNGGSNDWDPGINDRDLEPVGGPRNGARYPAFFRFDVTASREFARWGASWTPFASVINATNYRNVFVYDFDYTDNPPTRTAFSQFPILPSIGLTVRW